jgi:hypothetical protein
MVPFSAAAPPRDCCACASDVAAWHSASTSDRRLSALLKYPMERCRSCALPVFGMSSSTSATRRYPSAASSLACAWRRTRGRGPQPGELRARIGHDRWFQQDIPRHRILFTKLGLVALVERCGFDPRWTTTRLIDQNLLGMWQTLLNLVTRERDVLFRALKRQPVAARDLALTLAAAPVMAPIAVGLELVAGVLGRGGSVVVRATARPRALAEAAPASPRPRKNIPVP